MERFGQDDPRYDLTRVSDRDLRAGRVPSRSADFRAYISSLLRQEQRLEDVHNEFWDSFTPIGFEHGSDADARRFFNRATLQKLGGSIDFPPSRFELLASDLRKMDREAIEKEKIRRSILKADNPNLFGG